MADPAARVVAYIVLLLAAFAGGWLARGAREEALLARERKALRAATLEMLARIRALPVPVAGDVAPQERERAE